jgi:hypothetical protein
MASNVLPHALQSKVINGLFPQLRLQNTTLQNILGVGLGGPFRMARGGFNFAYDIFDPTRDAGIVRMPSQTSANIQPRPVGQVQGRYPRIAETLPLTFDYMNDFRVLGGAENQVDAGAENYIAEQAKTLLQRVANAIEIQCAAMLRGHLYFTQSGDSLYHELSSSNNVIDIDFQIPSTENVDQLPLNTGSDTISAVWTTAGTDIHGDLLNIMGGFETTTGWPVGTIITSREVMNDILQNDSMKAIAGTSNAPMANVQLQNSNDRYYEFHAFPGVRFYVVNEVLNLGASQTLTRMVGAAQLTVLPPSDGSWLNYWEGSSTIIEETIGRQSIQSGLYAWSELRGDPARVELKSNYLGMPILKVPAAVAFGTVNGF